MGSRPWHECLLRTQEIHVWCGHAVFGSIFSFLVDTCISDCPAPVLIRQIRAIMRSIIAIAMLLALTAAGAAAALTDDGSTTFKDVGGVQNIVVSIRMQVRELLQ